MAETPSVKQLRASQKRTQRCATRASEERDADLADSGFTFDEHFQHHYLAHLLRDPVFFLHVRDDVEAELFTSELGQKAARLILGWAEENDSPPGSLIYTEIDNLRQYAAFNEADINQIKLYIKKLLDVELQNRRYLLDQHDKFLAHRKLLDMYPRFSDAMRKGEHTKARELLNEVVQFNSSHGHVGSFMPADPSERVERRLREDGERFWLLIEPLDSLDVSLKRGQIGIWQSQRSSGGKTAAFCHCAKAFGLQGKKSLVFTLEDGQEEWEDKFDMCISGLTKWNLDDAAEIEKRMRYWYRFGGGVHIVKFPAGSKVSDLRRYTRFLQSTHNWHPDAIIIDYIDLLGPESKELIGDLYGTGHEVMLHLSAWADDDAIVVWTGSQSSRSAMNETFADQQHVAQSIAKIFDAHLIISINRTSEEQQQGITQLHVVKNKNGPARFTRAIRSDFDTYHFYKRGFGD